MACVLFLAAKVFGWNKKKKKNAAAAAPWGVTASGSCDCDHNIRYRSAAVRTYVRTNVAMHITFKKYSRSYLYCGFLLDCLHVASIAQLGERGTEVAKVTGSIPVGGT